MTYSRDFRQTVRQREYQGRQINIDSNWLKLEELTATAKQSGRGAAGSLSLRFLIVDSLYVLHGNHVEVRYCMNMIKTKSAICSAGGHYVFFASGYPFNQNRNLFYSCQIFI